MNPNGNREVMSKKFIHRKHRKYIHYKYIQVDSLLVDSIAIAGVNLDGAKPLKAIDGTPLLIWE